LETAYAAVRSRFLDHLWAGLPSVVSAGDAAAELVAKHSLGRVTPVGDAGAVARAILELLEDDEERAACGRRARALGDELTWERALEPLARFCERPIMTSDRHREEPAPPAPAMLPDDAYQARVAALDHLWKLQPQELSSAVPLVGQAKQAANSLTRWYVAPIVEQQNAFNAATVHALQALAETLTRLVAEQPGVRQTLQDIQQHLADIDDAQTAMARTLAAGTPPAGDWGPQALERQ
jgi:hypothetical protein